MGGPIIGLARDQRNLWSLLNPIDIGTDLSIEDFVQTVRTVVGNVERRDRGVEMRRRC